MLPRSATILILLALAACSARSGTPEVGGQGCAGTEKLGEIAAEFRVLRAIRGHFQGGGWNAEVDTWMGPKHRIMIELGERLGASGCSQEQIVALLGEPDQIAGPGDATFDQVRETPDFAEPPQGPYDLIIYEWRGNHDFLYFVSQDRVIVGSGWWHAGD